MFRPPDPPPMSDRVDADGPITAALLTAVSGQPLALAESLLAAWLQTARVVTSDDAIVVFDTFVLGRPDPFLREGAHHLRAVRRAEQRGDFDEGPDSFADDRDGDDWDDGDQGEPPSLTDRVIDTLRPCPDSERLLDDARFRRMVWTLQRPDQSNCLPHARRRPGRASAPPSPAPGRGARIRPAHLPGTCRLAADAVAVAIESVDG